MPTRTMRRVYLAGPLGFSKIGRAGQADLSSLLTDGGYEVVDPFKLTPQDEVDRIAHLVPLDEQRVAWRALNSRIGRNESPGD